jgi:DNA-binding transcriptional ArsR family regulator
MNRKDALSLDTRRNIYSCIETFPGTNLAELVDKLSFSEGTIRYHIDYLKDRGLIYVENDGGFTRYYLKNKFKKDEMKILNLLRNKTCRQILLCILINSISSRNLLSIHINKHPTTVFHYLKKLRKLNIIIPVKNKNKDKVVVVTYTKRLSIKINNKRDVFYTIKDPYLLYDLFVVYKNKLFDDEIIDSLLEFYDGWIDIFFSKYNEDEKITINDIDSAMGGIEDMYYNLFPIPVIA